MAELTTQPTWPPALPASDEAHLISLATDYALSHGLVYRPPAPSSTEPPSTTTVIHAPYALFPCPFPAHLYAEALALQPLYNSLYAQVSVDDEFLDEVVGGTVAKVDEFQGKLYETWNKAKKVGIVQPLHLGLFRSDYLIDLPPGTDPAKATIKQVEFNTISSSFGALSSRVSDLHRYLQSSGAYPHDIPELQKLEALPKNAALTGLANGLAEGHKAFGNPEAKLLMITQDHERNAFDQLALTYELHTTHNLTLLRFPFSVLLSHLTLSPTSKDLILTHPSLPSPTVISVVYYRSGYTPTDYPSAAYWSLRLLIETATAIKCPTLALQLSGAKKVQQVLADPEVLSRFLEGKGGEVEGVREESGRALLEGSFTRLYPLDRSAKGEEAVKLAYREPEKFVLKPQREGGGNNVYRTDIPPYLDALAAKDANKPPDAPLEREAYILMDLIQPPPSSESIMVRAGTSTAHRSETVSELGIYGVALFRKSGDGSGVGGVVGEGVAKLKAVVGLGGGGGERGSSVEMVKNETVGHLLRTKGRESDEGGVAVGFSVIDSPVLV